METFEDLIVKWATVREFAEDMGVSPNTAAGWKRRKSIPSDYWADLLDAAARRKVQVAADDLVKFASRAA
jgi:transcriptional regulator with XRE-family HTH domain